MRNVAVDANPAVRPVATGTETYAREVARLLPAEAPELRFRFYASRPGPLPGVDLTVLPGRRLWSQARLPVELWRRPPDLFFAPSHVVPFLARGRALTVVHDLAFERHPGIYSPGERAYLRLTTRWAERRCDRLVTVSQATARDLTELHGVDPRRIAVVPEAASPPKPMTLAEARRRTEGLGIDRPYVLHVGRIGARKNQETALAAVRRLPDLLLVCAGPIFDKELAHRLGASDRCRLLGVVDAEDREALYRAAEALIFPSLYEGFGLPILEAMLRDLPVVTASISSLPEVGGDAALYVDDPLDAEGL
ncbi:MAG: glycosyltransferase family 4 protein, partial [Candidatus Dormibacteraeota bacterium]|nr:glycosyltransferase family 4 protein [Candidatus Dormibacteraeota bacterium]